MITTTDYSNYFSSGTNRPGEIAASREVGINPGISAKEIKNTRAGERALRELEKFAGTGLKVFVDSGAFSEVSFDGGWHIVKEITEDEWMRRLAMYDRLSHRLGSQLYCVAPDLVGSQKGTLARLKKYAPRMRRLHAKGANVIVALQRGRLTARQFAAKAAKVLGFDFVYGIPMMKGATSLEELQALAGELKPGTRIHLLGKGVHSKDETRGGEFRPGFNKCKAAVAHLDATFDACRIAALVGRTNGKGGGPRVLTQARDKAQKEVGRLGLDKEAHTYEVYRRSVAAVLKNELAQAVTTAAVAA